MRNGRTPAEEAEVTGVHGSEPRSRKMKSVRGNVAGLRLSRRGRRFKGWQGLD